jgi:hypothetical protein
LRMRLHSRCRGLRSSLAAAAPPGARDRSDRGARAGAEGCPDSAVSWIGFSGKYLTTTLDIPSEVWDDLGYSGPYLNITHLVSSCSPGVWLAYSYSQESSCVCGCHLLL